MNINNSAKFYGFNAFHALEKMMDAVIFNRDSDYLRELSNKHQSLGEKSIVKGFYLCGPFHLAILPTGEIVDDRLMRIPVEWVYKAAEAVRTSRDVKFQVMCEKLMKACTYANTDWNTPFDLIKQSAIENRLIAYLKADKGSVDFLKLSREFFSEFGKGFADSFDHVLFPHEDDHIYD